MKMGEEGDQERYRVGLGNFGVEKKKRELSKAPPGEKNKKNCEAASGTREPVSGKLPHVYAKKLSGRPKKEKRTFLQGNPMTATWGQSC